MPLLRASQLLPPSALTMHAAEKCAGEDQAAFGLSHDRADVFVGDGAVGNAPVGMTGFALDGDAPSRVPTRICCDGDVDE